MRRERAARALEDRTRIKAAISALHADQVRRAEHVSEWAANDDKLANIQRQIDELRQAQGSLYGQRNIFLDLKDRINPIELERDRSPPGTDP